MASKAVAFGDLDGASHCSKDSLFTVVMTLIRPVGQIQTRLGVQGPPDRANRQTGQEGT